MPRCSDGHATPSPPTKSADVRCSSSVSAVTAFLIGAVRVFSPSSYHLPCLQTFSQSPRFGLAVDMVEEAERAAAERLFTRLDADAQAGASIKSASGLKALFFS